jgi:hypothetical protein
VAGPLISLGEINNRSNVGETTVAGRLLGKGAIVTDPTEYNAADIVALFREKGAEVFAESWDMTKPEMADEIVREAGHVDIPIANLAYPHTYAPAHSSNIRGPAEPAATIQSP